MSALDRDVATADHLDRPAYHALNALADACFDVLASELVEEAIGDPQQLSSPQLFKRVCGDPDLATALNRMILLDQTLPSPRFGLAHIVTEAGIAGWLGLPVGQAPVDPGCSIHTRQSFDGRCLRRTDWING